MSTVRKSPSESATLYKVGTKKIGNDGNKWIIVENKNNVKRWQIYKKKQSKKSFINTPIVELYNFSKSKKNNWSKWLENLTHIQKKYIKTIRDSYKSIEEETGIIIIEVILPISENGVYFIDYVWDYARDIYRNKKLDNF
jgi:hypothetical protein